MTAFHLAAKSGNSAYIPLLIQYLIDPNAQDASGYTALHYAVETKSVDFVKTITQEVSGLRVNLEDCWRRTPLHLAAENGDHEITQLLLACRSTSQNWKDSDGNTPLHKATASGHIKCVEALCGPENLNEPGENGATVLHIAASHGLREIVDLLLDKGADIDVMGGPGTLQTPLDQAIVHERLDIVDLLLDRDASTQKPDESGWHPLHTA
ncbi:ankyrin repeat-containing domain protein, partial [Xylariales sp. AK1849]